MSLTDDRVVIDKNELIKLIKKCYTLIKIGEVFICSKTTIRNRLIKYGIYELYWEKSANNKYKYDISRRDLLTMTANQISEKYNCTRQAAWYRKKEIKRKG